MTRGYSRSVVSSYMYLHEQDLPKCSYTENCSKCADDYTYSIDLVINYSIDLVMDFALKMSYKGTLNAVD